MRTIDFSRVFSSSPVNATAARVLSGGINYEERPINEMHWHFDAPPTVMPKSKHPLADSFVDLTGRKYGRFTVIGFYGTRNKKRKALWLVRCACGDYEVRQARVIKSAADPDACCTYCKRVARMKSGFSHVAGTPA